MFKCETLNSTEGYVLKPVAPKVTEALNFLRLVTAHEVKHLDEAFSRGQMPPDLESKLTKLAAGDLIHRSIEQSCRTIIALLQAARNGSFKLATPNDCERLLRVLAYVRKDDDLIADYRSDGFTDDQQVTRGVAVQLKPLLQKYKNWRLCHQVPAMWR